MAKHTDRATNPRGGAAFRNLHRRCSPFSGSSRELRPRKEHCFYLSRYPFACILPCPARAREKSQIYSATLRASLGASEPPPAAEFENDDLLSRIKTRDERSDRKKRSRKERTRQERGDRGGEWMEIARKSLRQNTGVGQNKARTREQDGHAGFEERVTLHMASASAGGQ